MTTTPVRTKSVSRLAADLLGIAGLLLGTGGIVVWWRGRAVPDTPVAKADAVRNLVASEDLILRLTPKLKGLKESAFNLVLPDHHSADLFAPAVTVVDLEPGHGEVAEVLDTVGVSRLLLHPAHHAEVRPVGDLALWRSLLADLRYFDNVKFYIARGEFDGGDPDRYLSKMGFSGLARHRDGSWRAIHVDQDVRWVRVPAAGDREESWQIDAWTTTHADVLRSDRLLFRDALRDAIADDDLLIRARRSIHEQKLVSLYRDGKTALRKKEYMKYFAPDALGQHPALSVADVNGDGIDDLFVMDRWSKAMLLIGHADGTFEDGAERMGLDIAGLTTGAVFADFDNDGDADVMISRSLERSMYLCNEDGRFVDRSGEWVGVPLPYLATSVSAADYNGDGLLDVYFSTYALPRRELPDLASACEFMPEPDARELFRRADESRSRGNPFANMAGPRNLLLVNRGAGRFERAPHDEQLDHWVNTFQATWSDFDNDGDADLYLANDYAPDLLFRNRGGAQGFDQVAEQFGGAAMRGFGMGASFGDYDNDGAQDLYVSNMFSKAGTRIADQVPGLDFRLRMAAEGNLLFHNVGEKFDLVSGLKPPALQVARAGWSWGGMFSDLDADGYLDIYVSSGYYSAPAEIASEVDL